ncbi:MAG TPA: aldehyde dehydrogenase family protein, partial [Vicinamibacteria bacterium]
MSTLAHLAGREELVAEIAREVVLRLRAAGAAPAKPAAAPAPPAPAAALVDGVFATVDAAVEAAAAAQRRIAAMSLEERGRVVGIIRRLCDEHAEDLGRRELEETGIGRLDHKIEKLRIV